MRVSLEELVSENRFTIAVVFPLFGAALLLASAQGLVPNIISFNPYLIMFGTAVMRLPLIAGVLPLLEGSRARTGVAALILFTYLIELVGVSSGFPYGSFEYGISLGPMVAGIPVGLPIFYLPLVLNAYLLVMLLLPDRTERRAPRILSVLVVLLLMDAVLDPAAVALNFWSYSGGFFHGVPLSNFRGWILSGTVSILIMDLTFKRNKLKERLKSCDFMLDDLVSFTFLWGVVNLFYQNLIPSGLAILFLLILLKADRFDTHLILGE